MNLWNDLETFTPFGEALSVIEISKDTNVKYEYNIDEGVFVLERCLISAMRYPCNYGFLPQTLGDDDDPLDVIIYSGVPLNMGCVVNGKVLGALDMEDKGKKDYKILIVPSFNREKITSLQDIEEEYLAVIADFFSHYKNVSGSRVKVNGWIGADETLKIINDSIFKPTKKNERRYTTRLGNSNQRQD